MRPLRHNFILIFGLLIAGCTPQPATEKAPLTTVSKSSTTYIPAEGQEQPSIQHIRAASEDIKLLMREHIAERKIPGVAYGVVMNNELIIADAIGLIDLEKQTASATDAVFRIASMSKSFTAMAILKLRDEGKLSLDDFAEDYIPEMRNLNYLTSDAPPIRIFNLLTMSAGFPEDNPWGDRQLDESDQMLMDLMNSGANFSSVTGLRYEYSNTGFALLGNIITRVSGMPYQDYITNNILQPLGMTNTYWEFDDAPADKLVLGYRWEDEQWKLEPMLHDGAFGAMGGLLTTIEDFSKYVSFHLSAWPPRSGPDNGPVRRSSLREMHNPTFARLNTRSTDINGEPCASMVAYGFGLRITKYCNGMVQVGHGGALPGFGSNYVFYPEYGVGIMAFGNRTYTGPYPLRKIEQRLFGGDNLLPRKLPVSDILETRTAQVAELIQTWDPALEKEILAENFFLDWSKEYRKSEIDKVLAQAGAITSIDPINNYNELRGRFEIQAENGTIEVFYTLTPEADPKVQRLDVRFVE